MPYKIDTQALSIVVALHRPDGLPQQWQSIDKVRGAKDEAFQHTINTGWLVVEDGHSICLAITAAGMRSVPGRRRRSPLPALIYPIMPRPL